MAADQAVPGKICGEAQTALAQQQTTTANARQQLINLGFSADEIASLVVDKETGTELPLVTPWAGTIVGRDAVEGQLVDRNAPLFDLADLATMWVYLNLYEADLGRVKHGQTVTFVPDGLAGRELHRPDRLDQSRGRRAARGSRKSAPNWSTPTDCCGPTCMAAEKSSSSRRTKGLVVPAAAVQDYRRQPVVFVQQSPEAFAVRPITVGVKLDGTWEVLSGVTPGEMVVTTGSFLLRSDLEKDKLGPAE